MKYFFALSFLLIAGCSHPTSTNTIPAGPMSLIYQPGGKYYMAPGTFTGTWITTYITNNVFINDTNPCTAVIKEADSLLFGTITNDSTKESLRLTGSIGVSQTVIPDPLFYGVQSISSLGDTDLGEAINFFTTGDTLLYSGSETPRSDSAPVFEINSRRK
jgi:hypothetical protein